MNTFRFIVFYGDKRKRKTKKQLINQLIDKKIVLKRRRMKKNLSEQRSKGMGTFGKNLFRGETFIQFLARAV